MWSGGEYKKETARKYQFENAYAAINKLEQAGYIITKMSTREVRKALQGLGMVISNREAAQIKQVASKNSFESDKFD